MRSTRTMLGLADRARIIDLFENVMRGKVADALTEFRNQYDAGADPVALLTDLAEFCHLVTRIRFVPEVANDFSLTEDERLRGKEYAQTLSTRTLSRAWQMLLKGITETAESNRPVSTAEMVLIRLAHTADLPTLDEALKGLDAAGPATSLPASQPVNGGSTGPSAMLKSVAGGAPQRVIAPTPQQAPSVEAAPLVTIASLKDLADLAEKKRDIHLRLLVEKYVRLVRVEQGRLDINLAEAAPKTLAGDLSKKLQEWTGQRWMVSVSAEMGGQTLDEVKNDHRSTLLNDAKSDPDVAAILARFPGAKIIDVKIAGDASLPESIEIELPAIENLAPDDDMDDN